MLCVCVFVFELTSLMAVGGRKREGETRNTDGRVGRVREGGVGRAFLFLGEILVLYLQSW
jgi:hypothetical protein